MITSESLKHRKEFLQKQLSHLEYLLFRKLWLERTHKDSLQQLIDFANELEKNGLTCHQISERLVDYAQTHFPDLKILIDQSSHDIYVEAVTVATRVYFNWQYRARSRRQ